MNNFWGMGEVWQQPKELLTVEPKASLSNGNHPSIEETSLYHNLTKHLNAFFLFDSKFKKMKIDDPGIGFVCPKIK